jgi:hypothetical protein
MGIEEVAGIGYGCHRCTSTSSRALRESPEQGRTLLRMPRVQLVGYHMRLEYADYKSPQLEIMRRIGTKRDQMNTLKTNEYTVQNPTNHQKRHPYMHSCLYVVCTTPRKGYLHRRSEKKICPRKIPISQNSSTPRIKSAVTKADYTARSSTHSGPKRTTQPCNPFSSSNMS